jgi:hypothetical protein
LDKLLKPKVEPSIRSALKRAHQKPSLLRHGRLQQQQLPASCHQRAPPNQDATVRNRTLRLMCLAAAPPLLCNAQAPSLKLRQIEPDVSPQTATRWVEERKVDLPRFSFFNRATSNPAKTALFRWIES